jgi:VCBS repeat-containing protein
MRSRSVFDLQGTSGDSSDSDLNFTPVVPGALPSQTSANPPGSVPSSTPVAPVLPDESVQAMAAVSGSGSGGTGSVIAETSSSGFAVNLIFDAAAMAAPASFRTGIEEAAAILSETITNKITVNLNIDYSGTGGGAAAGPDNGQFVSYSAVRSDLIANAAPGDTSFNALPTGTTIQGQSSVAVWNAQLKLFGLLSPNSTTTDDGSATFATDINPNLLVGVALHELTHAMGRVPYGPEPDIFDFYRFTSPGTRLFTDNIPATAAYFSLNGGNTVLADFGLYSDPSDFLNSANSALQGPYSNLTPNDPFNELYGNNTLQSLTSVDVQMLDALGFNTMPLGLVVVGNTAESLQGGPAVSLLSAAPAINDPGSTTLAGATVKIANSSGNAVAGDELFVNGTQNDSVGNGVTASWNPTTDTLTLSGTASVAVYDTLLSEITFQDTGTDTSSGSHPVRSVTWSINDGTNSYSATSTVDVDRAPIAANNAATDVPGATITTTAATGVLANASDLDGDSLTITAVNDTSHGAGTVGTSLAGAYGHLTLNSNGSYSYVADNTAAIASAATGSHLQDIFNYTVSDGSGGMANESLTIALDRTPVVTAANVTLNIGQTTIAASSLFSATDPDGNTITTYAVEDTGPGHFVLNGTTVEPNNQEIDLTAAQLAQLTYQGVTGSIDTLEVRVNDGTLWSSWQSFTVTTPHLIQTDNSTSLVEINNNYFLDPASGGTGPELTIGGAALGPTQLGSWTPIGAVQTASGYDVALELPGANEFTVWATSSSGAYVSSLVGIVPGNNTTLESLETVFNQDLNGDGTIGVPPPPPPTTISIDGNTTLVQSGSNYFLDVTGSNSLGPELTLGGAALGPTQLGSWAPIAAVQTASGYDVAFKLAGTDFTVWATDSSGAYVSSLVGIVPGNNTTLESLETVFNKDLNGDGIIGLPPPPPPTTISIDGNTTLVESGSNYFLDVTGSNSLGPELTLGGVALGPTQLGSWAPIAAVQTASGYNVAFELLGTTNEFTVWATDSNGAYVSSLVGVVPGNNATLESLETIFNKDLNGDGTIGLPPPPPPTTISIDGNTTFVESGSNYFFDVTGSNTLGPELTIGGAALGPTQLGSWTPIAAVQTASGYDVALELPGANEFTVWATNSSGAYVSSLVGIVPGNDATLESLETVFNQDLNGDGHIGPPPPPPPQLIQTDGSTSLYQVGNNYFLDPASGGTGPELTLGGAAFVEGQGGGWAPIGAVQTASGYDVAFKLAGTDDFTVWAANSSGAYVSSLVGIVPGSDATLESLETVFNQDLNGDGHIGVPSAASTATVASNTVADNFLFTSSSGPVIESAAGGASSQQSSVVSIGTDVFVFAPNFGQITIANFVPATDTIEISKTMFANVQALLAATHDNSSGNAVITDAAQDTITFKGVTTAQLLAHQSDFHFI